MNWRGILAITRKDLLDAVRNRYILFALVLPVGMSLFFRLITFGPDTIGALTIVVHDPSSSRLVAELRNLTRVQLWVVDSDHKLLEEVEKKQAVGGLAVPTGFDAAIEAGERPQLIAYLNRQRNAAERAVFRRLLEQQIWALVTHAPPAHIVWTEVAVPLGSPDGGAPDLDRYLLVIVLIMALAMTGGLVVPLLLVEEKEKHTLEFLLVSPTSQAEVVASKAITGLVYNLVISGVLMALNQGWSGGGLITFLTVLLGALFTAAVGLLVGSLSHNTMQVNTWGSLIAVGLIMPTWSLTSVVLPPALGAITQLIPTYHFVEALKLILAGEASFTQAWVHLTILFTTIIIAFAAVVWILSREEK